MDFEKAYKESFEAAKGLHEAGNALTKKQMEIVFPQLAESEDEKIRKSLIDYFTSYKIGNVETKLNGYRIDGILAYLEKQKEPENISASTMVVPSCFEVEQKEQEPTKYLDKDMVYTIMKKLHDLSFSQLIPINSEEYKKIGEITSDVRSLLDYPIEQKPAEVDESTKRLNENWMKQHFDDYKEQKPAEWSEEDEDMLNSCISSIEEAKENRYAYKETDGDTSYDHEIAWLKSLRPVSKEFLQPHWKPSEEQMKWLKDVIETVPMTCRQQGPLESLYADLQKLL